MNLKELKKKSLSELIEIRTITSEFCEKYAKFLTDYSVTQTTGEQLKNMTPEKLDKLNKRKIFIELLGAVDKIIEDKLIELHDVKN